MPRNQDQGVYCHRQMPETSTVTLESGQRYLKSRQMYTEIRTIVPENPGLKIKISMPITWVSMAEIEATVPRHQNHGVCYYRQIPQTRTVCLDSGPRCFKSSKTCTEIRVKMPEIKGNVYKDQGQCS